MLGYIKGKIGNYYAKKTQKIITDLEVCRFLFTKNNYSSERKEVKPSAFMDNRKPKELSVYQNMLSKIEMIKIGNKFVGNRHRPKKEVKALAIIHSDNIEKHKIKNQNLKVISYKYPHKLHCNIDLIDYDDYADFNILAEKSIASQMAMDSRLELAYNNE